MAAGAKEVRRLLLRLQALDLEAQQLRARVNQLERQRLFEATRTVLDDEHVHALELCSFTNTVDLFHNQPGAAMPVGEVRRWRNGWLGLYLTHMPLNGRLLVRPKG